jgi:hypothetical protein
MFRRSYQSPLPPNITLNGGREIHTDQEWIQNLLRHVPFSQRMGERERFEAIRGLSAHVGIQTARNPSHYGLSIGDGLDVRRGDIHTFTPTRIYDISRGITGRVESTPHSLTLGHQNIPVVQLYQDRTGGHYGITNQSIIHGIQFSNSGTFSAVNTMYPHLPEESPRFYINSRQGNIDSSGRINGPHDYIVETLKQRLRELLDPRQQRH